jgi:omega-6 fatty acid desaturase (delta-12 desaturase)
MQADNADRSAIANNSPGARSEVKSILTRHRGANVAKSISQLSVTLALFAGMWLLMWFSLAAPYWVTALLALPTAGLAVRLFILQHDCGHGSLFSSVRVNQILGTLLGAITLTPFACWRRQHAIHHASNGQLDHRGVGDIATITLAEYQALSRWKRFRYRLYRHPLVMFGIGPLVYFAVLQRFTIGLPTKWKHERLSVHLTNLMIAGIFLFLAWLVGLPALVKIHLPVSALAASFGVWLFYIQHQFEPTYWEHDTNWDHQQAAIQGSSFLDLPWPLSWLTAGIGYHHIHHLDSRIPNYALARCYRSHPELRLAQRVTLWSSLRCVGLKLWDEQSRQLISFREARQRAQNLDHSSYRHSRQAGSGNC